MNSFVAIFDVGTTSLKAALLSPHGATSHQRVVPLTTWTGTEGAVEQDTDHWFRALAEVATTWWHAGVNPSSIAMIAMTGQMQNLVPVDAKAGALCRAILYSDMRAAEESESVNQCFGESVLRAQLGNQVTAGSLLPKMIRWRNRNPELFARTSRFLFGAKDYLVLALCGKHVCDPTTASTTGLYLPGAQAWHASLLAAFGFAMDLMPEIRAPGDIAGNVSASACAQTGFLEGTPVICGLGDAAATTLGAGVTECHRPYLYLGTTGWIAHLLPAKDLLPPATDVIFTLAGADPGTALRLAPVLNAGNIVSWALTLVGCTPGDDPEKFFRILEEEAATVDGVGDLQFIPYLNAERCPIQTTSPNGALIGMSVTTTRAQILRSILEGLAQSLRWCAQLLDVQGDGNMRVIGGGTRNRIWLQSVADAFGRALHVSPDSDMLPALGVGLIAARSLGWAVDAKEFLRSASGAASSLVIPDASRSAALKQRYASFKRIAQTVVSMPR